MKKILYSFILMFSLFIFTNLVEASCYNSESERVSASSKCAGNNGYYDDAILYNKSWKFCCRYDGVVNDAWVNDWADSYTWWELDWDDSNQINYYGDNNNMDIDSDWLVNTDNFYSLNNNQQQGNWSALDRVWNGVGTQIADELNQQQSNWSALDRVWDGVGTQIADELNQQQNDWSAIDRVWDGVGTQIAEQNNQQQSDWSAIDRVWNGVGAQITEQFKKYFK